jgi:hypothetical protein
MASEDQFIVSLKVNELTKIIDESIAKAFSKIPPPVEEDILIKRKDVSTIYSVSLVTVAAWMKSGKIPYYRINSRIFFKKSEVMEAMQSKKEFKRFRNINTK